jgi:hypothetical protein
MKDQRRTSKVLAFMICTDRLTPEALAAAARKKRPGAKYRTEFRALRRRREMKLASKPSGGAAG